MASSSTDISSKFLAGDPMPSSVRRPVPLFDPPRQDRYSFEICVRFHFLEGLLDLVAGINAARIVIT